MSPGRCSSGSSSWEGTRQGHLGCRHHVVFKTSLVLDGGRRKDSNSFSLSAIHLPVCEVVCVCVRVFVSMEKDRNTGEDLPL